MEPWQQHRHVGSLEFASGVYSLHFLKVAPLQMQTILHHIRETKNWEDKSYIHTLTQVSLPMRFKIRVSFQDSSTLTERVLTFPKPVMSNNTSLPLDFSVVQVNGPKSDAGSTSVISLQPPASTKTTSLLFRNVLALKTQPSFRSWSIQRPSPSPSNEGLKKA